MRIVELNLEQIQAGHETQARVQLDWIALEEYANLMRDGVEFPPVVVYFDGDQYWLADGYHRLAAAKQAELTTIGAQVEKGGKRDAMLHACGANAAHGVRRTNADKRRAVELLLNDAEWRQWSDREIARRCAVGHPLVAEMRSHLEEIPDTPRKFTRNGTTYTMDTANIGKRAEPVRYANVDDGLGPAEDDVPDEWAAGAVGLDRDWTDEELEDYAGAHKVVVPQPQPEWTESELTRRGYVENQGWAVHANMKTDHALIAWAKKRGIFQRIDRMTEWGNPFHFPADGDRLEVVENYQWYLEHKPSLLGKINTLGGKVLGCWCYPEMCHGEVLEEYANDTAD